VFFGLSRRIAVGNSAPFAAYLSPLI